MQFVMNDPSNLWFHMQHHNCLCIICISKNYFGIIIFSVSAYVAIQKVEVVHQYYRYCLVGGYWINQRLEGVVVCLSSVCVCVGLLKASCLQLPSIFFLCLTRKFNLILGRFMEGCCQNLDLVSPFVWVCLKPFFFNNFHRLFRAQLGSLIWCWADLWKDAVWISLEI